MDPMLQWFLGAVVTVIVATVGGFVKYVLSVIKNHKADTDQKIRDLKEDLEKQRNEATENLTKLILAKLETIWEAINGLREKD